MKEVYTTRLDYEIDSDPAGDNQFHYFGQSVI